MSGLARGFFMEKGLRRFQRSFVTKVTNATGVVYETGVGTYDFSTGAVQFGIENSGGIDLQEDGYVAFNTSVIPASATITFAAFTWRTTTTIETGTIPIKEVDLAMSPSLGALGTSDWRAGTVISANVTQAATTSYSYTLTSGQYALIATGAGAQTSVIFQNGASTSGVAGDTFYQNISNAGILHHG